MQQRLHITPVIYELEELNILIVFSLLAAEALLHGETVTEPQAVPVAEPQAVPEYKIPQEAEQLPDKEVLNPQAVLVVQSMFLALFGVLPEEMDSSDLEEHLITIRIITLSAA